MGEPAVYDVHTLAERWGCSIRTIRSLLSSGDLSSFRLGGKLVRIRADEVEKFECRTTPSNDTGDSSPSPGTRTADATAIRLERQIVRQQKPQRGASGRGAQ